MSQGSVVSDDGKVNPTIWKVVLDLTDEQSVQLPALAEILCAREQHDQICIWFRCHPSAPKQSREIAIVGTGHPAPAAHEARYLGSASLHEGQFIFHVFERAAITKATGAAS